MGVARNKAGSGLAALPADTRGPVNQRIYRMLREAIVKGTFPPGSPLSEKDVSEHFGVSRQPVREAFIKLGEAGLVRVLPQRGTFVMKISPKRVEDGRFIREAVEVAVAGRAAQRVTAAQLAAMAELLDRQRRAARENDTAAFLDLDDAFHQAIAGAADCPAVWQTIENIKANMDRVRYLSLAEVSPLEMLIDQHQAIFQALRDGDPQAAQAAMGHHLRELTMSFEPIRARNPDWFGADED
ncbi:GntR family transcriptional regulator [Bordetella genomosp. 11]|uniref:GntR family transcriptional regulator n=1 Tax=Bordetella genomosp. 11 TaxID=1416808 RepID=A0A261UI52_9BORD|nr:GntR family transcriptional regulator [Bordetella genomosp. 11]OZI61618.1 GntR family transcriptional regulator [Bordetella genomosp. 11]